MGMPRGNPAGREVQMIHKPIKPRLRGQGRQAAAPLLALRHRPRLPRSLGLLAFAIHLGLQARRVRVDDPRLALRLFKSNAGAGLILFAALAAGRL